MIFLIYLLLFPISIFGQTNTELENNFNNTNNIKARKAVEVPKNMYHLTNYLTIYQFFTAIQNGDTYQIKDLLDQGIHPDIRKPDNNNTALIIAISFRRERIVQLLLDRGANPNLSAQSKGISNITPLMIAAQQGPLEIVQEIINYGADINAVTTSGVTALMSAIKNQRGDIVQCLLSQNADINLATTQGEITNITALMIATQTGNIEITKQLLNSPKINIQRTDSTGKNALIYAYISGNISMINLLLASGLSTEFTPQELEVFFPKNQKN
ncbi:MAG: ankyrin repeat domain-containing protein [Brevinema sp.]